MAVLGQVLIEIAANSAAFRSELERARGQFGQFTSAIKTGLATLGVAASVAGLTAMVRSALDAGAATREMATRMGIGTRELQELQHAARDTGTNLEALETGIRNLSRSLDEAASDSAQARETFQRLGISWRDSTGNVRDVLEVLDEVADKLNLQEPAARAALAIQLFGRSGTGMLTLLREGSKGMSELRAEAQRLGAVMSDESLKALDDLQDGFDKAAHSLKVAFMEAVVAAKPLLESLITVISGVATALSKLIEKAKEWRIVQGLGLDVIRDELRDWFGPSASPGAPAAGGERFGPPSPPRGAPALTTAQQIQSAQAQAAALQNRLAITGAAQLAAPGSEAEGLQRQINLSQQKMRLDLEALATQHNLELTDKGRFELQQKAGKVIADSIVEQIRLYAQLTEATQRQTQAEAALFDFSGEAVVSQRDIDLENERSRIQQENLKATRDLLRDLAAGPGEGSLTAPQEMLDAMTAAQGKPLADFKRSMREIDDSTRVLGTSFNRTAAEIAATQKAISDLIRVGVSPADERIKDLVTDLERMQAVSNVIGDVFSGLRGAVSGMVQGLLQGTQTVSQAFANMGRNIAASILENVINRGLKAAESALIDFAIAAAKLGIGPAVSGILGTTATPAASALGPTVLPVQLQHGGVVMQPTLATVAETAPEAVIPLSRLGQLGGPQIIIQNYSGGSVETKQGTGPNGEQIYRVVINAVKSAVANGAWDSIMSPYNMRRQPAGR